MMNCYIHSAVSISTQNTFDTEDFLEDIAIPDKDKIKAIHPNYKDFISPIASRRMATGVKMGVVAAKKALQLANLEQPDAIITGTGMGCIEDTETFLNAIIKNNEAYLTPTSFIQSTHNTVGAQIALGLKCKGYNNTFTHANLSFESALIDAQLMLTQQEASHILVGGVDELGTELVDYVLMMEKKNESGIRVPFGEGASFFILSSEDKPDAVQLKDITAFSNVSKEEVTTKMINFLSENNIKTRDIDAIILGNNGDGFDVYYDHLASTLFLKTPQIHYKYLSGEFYTASAFGFWLGNKILENQHIPKMFLKNSIERKQYNTVLLYNQFKGRNHSFILLTKC